MEGGFVNPDPDKILNQLAELTQAVRFITTRANNPKEDTL